MGKSDGAAGEGGGDLLGMGRVRAVAGKGAPQASTRAEDDTSATSCVALVASGASSGAYPLTYIAPQSSDCTSHRDKVAD